MASVGNAKGLLKDLKKTVDIENVAPAVDCGRYPVKREVDDVVEVTADIFREGHEQLLAFLKFRRFDQERSFGIERRLRKKADSRDLIG